jgi:hypothetical protein
MASVLVVPQIARWMRLKQGLLTAARLFSESFTWRCTFITLTYREDVAWEANQIRYFSKRLREWCLARRVAVRALWCLETTKRGRPHYHVLVFLPRALSLPKPDKAGWWRLGSTKIETARNPVGYMVGYLAKGGQTCFTAPKGARIYGASGLDADQRQEKSWWMKPRWVRDVFAPADRPQKVRGGYLSRLTGEFLKSPWVLSERGPKWRWFEFSSVDDPPSEAVSIRV